MQETFEAVEKQLLEEANDGPQAPEDIREAFLWHEKRLSMRGLFPQGLDRGISIQHHFKEGDVITPEKAENGLVAHPEYGIRGWTKSQVEQFKKAGYIMNGYLGEEGQFGYLAASAGGVRRQAKKIRAENPVFKKEEIMMLKYREANAEAPTYEELQQKRTEQFKKYIADENARREAEMEAKWREEKKRRKKL